MNNRFGFHYEHRDYKLSSRLFQETPTAGETEAPLPALPLEIWTYRWVGGDSVLGDKFGYMWKENSKGEESFCRSYNPFFEVWSNRQPSNEQGMQAELLQLCMTLWDPKDGSPPGSSVHGILQARILKWVAISYSRGSSQPREQICICYVSFIGRWVLYH